MSISPIVHCFVSREDYAEFRRISIDADGMAADYDTFAKAVQEFLDRVKDQGGIPVKVNIKPAELLAWCQSQGRDVDARARSEYAARVFADSDNN